MAKYVDERLTGLREWKRGQKRHRITLKAILGSEISVDNRRPSSFTPQSRHPPSQFHRLGTFHPEQIRSLRLSNQRLLQHLLTISLRSSTPGPSQPSRSLNTAMRKRQEKEICRENVRNKGRVQGRKSCFSAEKWEEEYKQSCLYRQRLSKPHTRSECRRQARTPGPRELLAFP